MDLAIKSDNEQHKSIGKAENEIGLPYKKSIKRKEMINIATWNIRSIFKEEELKNLLVVINKYKIHILALQETKLKEISISKYKEYVLFNSE